VEKEATRANRRRDFYVRQGNSLTIRTSRETLLTIRKVRSILITGLKKKEGDESLWDSDGEKALLLGPAEGGKQEQQQK